MSKKRAFRCGCKLFTRNDWERGLPNSGVLPHRIFCRPVRSLNHFASTKEAISVYLYSVSRTAEEELRADWETGRRSRGVSCSLDDLYCDLQRPLQHLRYVHRERNINDPFRVNSRRPYSSVVRRRAESLSLQHSAFEAGRVGQRPNIDQVSRKLSRATQPARSPFEDWLEEEQY